MHSGYEQMKSLSCVQNCELSLCVSNIVSAHQHVGLTRGLEHSGVWHGLGHDVPPDPVHLVGEIIIYIIQLLFFTLTLLNFRPSTGICFMMSSELKMGSR